MKTKIILSTLMSLLFASSFAQDRTTVNAMSSDISDNLDLRAVASIFGESKDLTDFEQRLNDPKAHISNLDLNNDNQVDYLRVIESSEKNTHLIVIQAVLGENKFQDVATVEVQKDPNNQVHVQVVGDVYMYGKNYIYEPEYTYVPVIYNWFWSPLYRPYYSSWYWGYYPSYYYAWNPFPLFRYRYNIGFYIDFNNHYNYVNYRRCEVAYNHYYGRRGNCYERAYPNRSFEYRNAGYGNRYELDQTRPRHDVAYNQSGTSSPRNFDNPRGNYSDSPRNNGSNPRENSYSSPRNYSETSPRGSSYTSVPRSSATNTLNQNPRNSYAQISTSNTTNYSPRQNYNQGGYQAGNTSPRNGGFNSSIQSEPRVMNGGNYAPRSNSGGSSTGGSSAPRNIGGSNSNGGSSGGGRSSSGGRR